MDEIKGGRSVKKYPYFEEETSVEVVNARMGADIDPRLREIMGVIVKHLHAAVKEIEPTHEEWLKAIQFLTEVGQTCTEWRQEFILLSDTLGVSMLVDSSIIAVPTVPPRTQSSVPSTCRRHPDTSMEPTSALTTRASPWWCAGGCSTRPAIQSPVR